MKHLLNDLTEQEKNSIREQHTGGMKVVTENFSKLINAKSGNVKPLVNEQPEDDNQTSLGVEDCFKQNPAGPIPNNYLRIINLLEKANCFATQSGNFGGGFNNWDEDLIKNAYLMINNQSDYNRLNKYLFCFYNSAAHEPLNEPYDTLQSIFYNAFAKLTDIFDKDIVEEIINHMEKRGIRMSDGGTFEIPD